MSTLFCPYILEALFRNFSQEDGYGKSKNFLWHFLSESLACLNQNSFLQCSFTLLLHFFGGFSLTPFPLFFWTFNKFILILSCHVQFISDYRLSSFQPLHSPLFFAFMPIPKLSYLPWFPFSYHLDTAYYSCNSYSLCFNDLWDFKVKTSMEVDKSHSALLDLLLWSSYDVHCKMGKFFNSHNSWYIVIHIFLIFCKLLEECFLQLPLKVIGRGLNPCLAEVKRIHTTNIKVTFDFHLLNSHTKLSFHFAVYIHKTS